MKQPTIRRQEGRQPFHSAQFYDDDACFLAKSSEYISTALNDGSVVVVIATEPHREGLVERLRAMGVDVATAREQGRYIALDAIETLATFMLAGMPDRTRFFDFMDSILRPTNVTEESCLPTVALGEMVALLANDGNFEAAIQLEQLWSDLALKYSLSLRCAYPMSSFHQVEHGKHLHSICAKHAHVIPGESYAGVATDEERRRAVLHFQQQTLALESALANLKQTEETLRLCEERFRLVTQATKDAIWDLDIRSGKARRSDNFWEQFGYPPREKEPDVSGWKELIHPEDRDRVWNEFQAALARYSDSYEIEYRIRKADQSYAVVLDRAYIVYDETGEPTRAIGAVTDLSERRALEEQLRQAQKMEAVGRLAGGVAHDFNNLLMVITAYVEIMQEQLSPENKFLKNLDQVKKAAERASSLTQQLLAFSRRQVLLPRIIDLNFVIEDSLKMIRRLIGEDIELNVSLDDSLRAVKADPGQVVQVLLNLCVNARDAMPNGGELAIGTENVSFDAEAARKRPGLIPGDYAALVVRDSGSGMTREIQAQIFEPFFTTKELGRGTGLGLSTVFGIVSQSGGCIWSDTKVGHGSSFTVNFPAVAAPLTRMITPAIDEAEGQGETVLLVEDDEALRDSISTYLVLHGYKVLEASDGVQALRVASQHAKSIQVLITDMILPKLSGMELAPQVARMAPQVVTLYMSGYTDRELIDYDPANLTTGYLQKPFALQTLLQKLREMIAAKV
jgi:PAS domain S-box-containing protein